MSKIFGIGFHKTGTTSLANALEHLGYHTCEARKGLLPYIKNGNWEVISQFIDRYAAFQGNPWPMLYRDLDSRFAGSKFILTIRDRRTWLGSVMDHFGERHTAMREWIYGHGAPASGPHIYLERYLRHNIEVQSYFSSRPQDFLVMDICEGDGWEKLAGFLGHPIPKTAFPGRNVRRAATTPPRTPVPAK